MKATEALEKICFLLKHDWYAPEIKAILEELEKSAKAEGYEAGYLHAQETVGEWNKP